MIQVIDGKRYNTATAAEVFTYWNGYSTSDFKYRTKRLFLTKKGNWFIHHKGGAMTDMAVSCGNGRGGSESIEPVSAKDAYAFLQANSDDGEALEALEKHFGSQIEDA